MVTYAHSQIATTLKRLNVQISERPHVYDHHGSFV
jgi:hypothetical protein